MEDDDLTDRLRGYYSMGPFGKRDFNPYVPPICVEAAERIEQLQQQNSLLKQQLKMFGIELV